MREIAIDLKKVRISLDPEQLKEIITQLKPTEKARLIEELQRDTWQERFKALLCRIDQRLKTHPLSEKEILLEVEKARQEYYVRSRS